MKRLKNLDVHEISLVKAGANRKKYLVLKNAHEGPMPNQSTPQQSFGDKLADAFALIPREKLEDAEAVIAKARSAIKKADGDTDNGGLPADDDTREALRAAFKLLAAHADQLNADTMADFVAALGIETDDQADDDANDQALADGSEEIAASKDGDATVGAELVDEKTQKADDDKPNDDKEKQSKSDDDAPKVEDDDKVGKDGETDEKDKDKEEAMKAGAPEGMPDFADASDEDIDAATAAARKAYADMMEQRGKKQAALDDRGQEPMEKTAVAKSRESVLKGLSDEQRSFLEPIFKAHEERVATLEKSHRELVEKSRKAEFNLKQREFVEKAAREYAHLGPANEVGLGLMRLHDRDPDGLAAWEAILKSANQRSKDGGETNLFSELGSSMSMPNNLSPEEELKQSVMGQVQKHAMSYEQAEAEFLNTPKGRNLYSKIQRQKRN